MFKIPAYDPFSIILMGAGILLGCKTGPFLLKPTVAVALTLGVVGLVLTGLVMAVYWLLDAAPQPAA
jgi:hypothetical protein